MLRPSHRRRPPVPVWVAAVMFVLAATAVIAAVIVENTWFLRGSVAVLALVLAANVWLLYRTRRMLRRAQVEAAGTSSALARAENSASREIIRRDHEIARLGGELTVASQQLAEVTGASLYAATVLAELFRKSPLMSGDWRAVGTHGAEGAAESDNAAEGAETKAASSTVVQVWPSIDDAPTVVDLLRWDQVRRMTDEPVAGNRRPA